MCDMDVISLSSAANILQAPANCLPYLPASEEELNRSYFSSQNCAERDDVGDSQEELCQVGSSKSLDSLNTLLDKLPDIVIPEPVHNPLPLQCLAAGSLPESVRSEIDTVLSEFSVVLKSPSHVLRQRVQRTLERPESLSFVPSMSGEMGEQSGACKKEDDKEKVASNKEEKEGPVGSEASGEVRIADKMEKEVQGTEVSDMEQEVLEEAFQLTGCIVDLK